MKFFLCAAFCAVLFSGCLRVAGKASYWKTGSGGQTTVKQAGFDTNELIQKGETSGNRVI